MTNKPAQQITFVSDPGGDWQGLYVDGKLVLEDHSLSGRRVLQALGLPFERVECDGDWIAENGNLPSKLEDVKLAVEG